MHNTVVITNTKKEKHMNTQQIQIQALERAQRGAEFLDEGVPGWEEKIDLGRLDIMSGDNCVIGQVYGNYWMAECRNVRGNYDQAVDRGFLVECDYVVGGCSCALRGPALIGAWREIVLTRRQQAQDAAYATYAQNIDWSPNHLMVHDEEIDPSFLDRFWATVEQV